MRVSKDITRKARKLERIEGEEINIRNDLISDMYDTGLFAGKHIMAVSISSRFPNEMKEDFYETSDELFNGIVTGLTFIRTESEDECIVVHWDNLAEKFNGDGKEVNKQWN